MDVFFNQLKNSGAPVNTPDDAYRSALDFKVSASDDLRYLKDLPYTTDKFKT
eukprot:CAMPEP_0184362806 /NCGR_PEP_ID=MMETSP1089-20130417/136622_1 /TAXON_ID=38269 ORGANISM="Gloeochaete wittrockiana, Strain SAG46.84" /NCGR_SAMPLE_ID=MMETSP1089 /ASSEMBLY_ACC=CAM_ASM_000445 /LENGTH=51 /DNA_ID=CAMNT_0026703047 /DNA_START=19 /DNA_END=170 /DNA_ORIENTATION=+